MMRTKKHLASKYEVAAKSKESRPTFFPRRKVAAWLLLLLVSEARYCLAEEEPSKSSGGSLLSAITQGKFLQNLIPRNRKQEGASEFADREASIDFKVHYSRNPKSHLHKAAKDFASTIPQRGQKEIFLHPLLIACRNFVSFLQQTAPSAVARDFENNLRKIEMSIAETKIGKKSSLFAFLKAERDSEIHRRRDSHSYILRDPSGSIGLLWVRRSLAFQSDIYQQLLDGSTPKHAALFAYGRQLEPYHGWTLRKFYTFFLSTNMPSERESMLEKIGGSHGELSPLKKQQTLNEIKELLEVWQPLLHQWKQTFVELGLEDTTQV